MTRYFPDALIPSPGGNTIGMIPPYGTLPPSNLVVTRQICPQAHQAAWNSTDDSTTEIPTQANNATVDQPTREIAELCSKIVSEVVAVEVATFRRDTARIHVIADKIDALLLGIRSLANLQRDAIITFP